MLKNEKQQMALQNEYRNRCAPWRRIDVSDDIPYSRKQLLSLFLWALWYPQFKFEISTYYSRDCHQLLHRRNVYYNVVKTFLCIK